MLGVSELDRECAAAVANELSAEDLPVDVEHHRLDLRRNRTRAIFREEPISAVVHLGTIYNPRRDPVSDHRTNIVGLQRLLGYVRSYNIPKLIVLSTADVYGPQAENITFLNSEQEKANDKLERVQE